MSTDLQHAPPAIDPAIVERVLIHGDLRQLTPAQKVSYYNAVCESIGLNPLTQPFQYLILNGREILYARKDATDQLRRLHNIGITIVGREVVEDQYIVTARATLPNGRPDESIGAVPIGNLKGESRSNALMKCETKAKRRATLSIVGLGMLDETELETIPREIIGTPITPAELPRQACPHCGSTEGETVPPGSGDAVCLHCGADWPRMMMGEYATVQAPPPPEAGVDPPEAELPAGAVRIERIDSYPTRNQNVTKYVLRLSTGEEIQTIKPLLASLAKSHCDNRTPVWIKTKTTPFGIDLDTLSTEPPPSGPLPF